MTDPTDCRRLAPPPCRWGRAAFFTLALSALVAAPRAQFERPEERIREIAEEVATEMKEIDRLLLEAGRGGSRSAAEGMTRVTERLDELLDQSKTSQQTVVERIDELIEEILKMPGQQGGQGQGQSPPPPPSPGSGTNRPRSRRRPSDVPDEHEPQPQGEQPQDGQREVEEDGQKMPAQQVPEDATEELRHQADNERWGMLPLYEEFFKGRGATPAVPEKYRRFHEAFLKNNQQRGSAPTRRR
ncbi:MAG: hypothetical protein AAF628_28735 [Planctomycetota bacterium]